MVPQLKRWVRIFYAPRADDALGAGPTRRRAHTMGVHPHAHAARPSRSRRAKARGRAGVGPLPLRMWRHPAVQPSPLRVDAAYRAAQPARSLVESACRQGRRRDGDIPNACTFPHIRPHTTPCPSLR
eukprot:361197-Chlamydomonas_euryale.AAC.6